MSRGNPPPQRKVAHCYGIRKKHDIQNKQSVVKNIIIRNKI